MRAFLLILSLSGSLLAQTFIQKLAAPIFYELSIEPNYQSNPLNLSDFEILKAFQDSDYLNGIEYSSSNVISMSGQFNYAPRLFAGRKSSFKLNLTHHYYHDIPQRSYDSFSMSLTQSLGKYRYLNLGYWILPKYYLRNYLYQDIRTLETSRQICNFGTDLLWVGFEHRLRHKNTLEYTLAFRNEIYEPPFTHYNLSMLEGDLKFTLRQFQHLIFSTELQYGRAENDNNYDEKDRSYTYLHVRPTLTLYLPGKHRLRLATRYEERAYNSEQFDDQLHAGRYQDEYRAEFSVLPKIPGALAIEPYIGYRQRQVDSSDPAVRELKSFSRYWFGIRFGFDSVIDMYF